jgi:FkbM family methyltransferase
MEYNIINRIIKKIIRIVNHFFKPNILSNKILLENNIKFTFGDQKGQVNFLVNNVFDYEKKGLKKNGFFIDLACADGVSINNTYFLERYLGWTGILFEPNPEYKKKILEKRKSKLITECVTDCVGEKIRFRIDNGMLGGIISEETDNNKRFRSKQLEKAKVIEIYTTTLEKELDEVNAPKIIDFLSLDVEGAEWIVMRLFPFHKYKFICMAIERPNKKLDILLESKGYKQVAHLMNDVLYVHEDFIDMVNFNPKIKFSFTPRKNW